MNRFRFFVVAAAFAANAIAAPRTPAAEPPARPNILWITCEDMSPDLGCYDAPNAWTPNLDRLASEGLVFDNAFATTPVCAPARSTLITGMYATSIGTQHMRSEGVPPPYVRCFPQYLRAAGYHCTNNSKTDYNFLKGPDGVPLGPWDESSGKAHWRNRPEGAPFFAVVNLTETHESQIRLSDDEFEKRVAAVPPERRHDPEKAVLPPYYADDPEARRDWARYEDLISAMDARVGEILAELAADGLADETIVFFFSDHGRGLPRAKRWLYDSGLRVPLIVRFPTGHPSAELNGTRTDRLASFVDFAPTVLSLAHVAIPSHLQGGAFLGADATEPREFAFATRDRMDETLDTMRGATDGRFKYILNLRPELPYAQRIDYAERTPTLRVWRRWNDEGRLNAVQSLFFAPTKPAEELYDTATDPHEVRNLAGDPAHAERLERMRAAVAEWMAATGDPGTLPEEELIERMRPGGVVETTAPPLIHVRKGVGMWNVALECPTDGASTVYTLDEGERPRWRLYRGIVAFEPGKTLRAKSQRIGFRPSEEVSRRFD